MLVTLMKMDYSLMESLANLIYIKIFYLDWFPKRILLKQIEVWSFTGEWGVERMTNLPGSPEHWARIHCRDSTPSNKNIR